MAEATELREWVPAWKVLRGDFSAIWWNHAGEVYYGLHDITRPQPGCGPLACFTHLRLAENFRSNEPNLYVSRDTVVVQVAILPSKIGKLYSPGRVRTLGELPPGSILADAVYRFE